MIKARPAITAPPTKEQHEQEPDLAWALSMASAPGVPTETSPIYSTAESGSDRSASGTQCTKTKNTNRTQDLPPPHLATYQLVCRARGKHTKLFLIFFPLLPPLLFSQHATSESLGAAEFNRHEHRK